MEAGKIDRRRRYTLSVIREAFFALLAEVGFAKMTVADICRRADINRGTFYLHYEDKFALLDVLIDEALAAAPPLEGAESGALCQRAPANDDYYLLYSDDDAYARVAQRVIERGAEQVVPQMMEKTGLSREDAYLLFVHSVQEISRSTACSVGGGDPSSPMPRNCSAPIPKEACERLRLAMIPAVHLDCGSFQAGGAAMNKKIAWQSALAEMLAALTKRSADCHALMLPRTIPSATACIHFG